MIIFVKIVEINLIMQLEKLVIAVERSLFSPNWFLLANYPICHRKAAISSIYARTYLIAQVLTEIPARVLLLLQWWAIEAKTSISSMIDLSARRINPPELKFEFSARLGWNEFSRWLVGDVASRLEKDLGSKGVGGVPQWSFTSRQPLGSYWRP